jgi:hypothetical protein
MGIGCFLVLIKKSKCYKNGNQLLTYRRRRYQMRHRWKRERERERERERAAERRGERCNGGSRQRAPSREQRLERESASSGSKKRSAGLQEEEERRWWRRAADSAEGKTEKEKLGF